MTGRSRRPAVRQPSPVWPVVMLVLVAVVPPLLTAPGRMPADSKLYLYLDPQRFLADAAGTFDPRQFAGWVPHQHISYLWPAGPWYHLADWVGLPDWVAHRLWVGALVAAAGVGVWVFARALGLGAPAALAAGLAYQLSPYVLPYASRTSVMLLPWAGLGWIVWATWRSVGRPGWRWPAIVGLVVFTVGSVNATALAMIVPAPLLVLMHSAAGSGRAGWRASCMAGLKIGITCLVASLWWIVQLIIQGRVGVDVLAYSESLADVARTSTSTEVWRQLGYWLFYIDDAGIRTTTESLRYMASSWSIAVSFAVPALALVGLAASAPSSPPWRHRRLAWAFVAVGGLAAVGVHPPDGRSPLVEAMTGGGDRGLALALRSSTRAVPVLSLGLALGLGALVTVLVARLARPGRQTPMRIGVLSMAVALVVINLPGWWTGSVVVDPAIDRDSEPPAAWLAAAEHLDERSASSDDPGRILQLPGAEFGAFEWGYTVDQPLPGLVDSPLVTRDLLPLGSPPAMDLLFAFDDRFQLGVAEPASIAPIARLLGVDTVWLVNDLADGRFDTARPGVVRDIVAAAPGIAPLDAFGTPGTFDAELERVDARAVADPRVGEPLPRVELAQLADAEGVVRVSDGAVLVAGSGSGLVDLAATGALDGPTSVRYAATVDDLASAVADSVAVVVTDSNRARARHWRSSQDTVGMTESADPALRPAAHPAGDSRLPIFDGAEGDRSHQTTAEQVGPLRATADWYGQRFAYLPEHRPWAAIDGDVDTAWLVAEHDDPLGVSFQLEVAAGIDQVGLLQAGSPDVRHITVVDITRPDGTTERVRLDHRSFDDAGHPIEVDAGWNEIRIVEVDGGTPFTPSIVAPVGFREVVHPGPATREVVRLPSETLAATDDGAALMIVLTRDRVDPADIWRDDPEPRIERSFTLPTARTFDVTTTLRIDRGATDAELSELFDWPAVASSRLDGMPNAAGVHAIDGDPTTAWFTDFDGALGARLTVVADDRVDELTIRQLDGMTRITEVDVTSGERVVTAPLETGPSGAAVVSFDPPLPAGSITLTAAAVDPVTTLDRRFGDVRSLPAAIAEITSPSIRVVDPTPSVQTECLDLAVVGGETITARLSIEGRDWMFGGAISAEVCAPTVDLGAGEVRVETIEPTVPVQLDRLVFDSGARAALSDAAAVPPPTAEVTERGRFSRTVRVDGCRDGCWFVLGEGWSSAWEASVDGVSLGDPEPLDGGFTGWRLPGGPGVMHVDVDWTAQGPLNLALAVSGLGVVALLALALGGRSTPATVHHPVERPHRTRRQRRAAAVWAVGTFALVGWSWWPFALIGTAALLLLGPRARVGWWAPSAVAALGVIIVIRERLDPAFANAAWPGQFADLHRVGAAAFVACLAAAFAADASEPADSGAPDRRPDTVAARD